MSSSSSRPQDSHSQEHCHSSRPRRICVRHNSTSERATRSGPVSLTRVAALLAVALLLLAWGAMAPATLFLGSKLPTSLCAPNAKLAGLRRTQHAGIHQLQLRSKGSSNGRVVAAGARAQAVSVQSPSVTFSTSEVNCPQKPLIFLLELRRSCFCAPCFVLHSKFCIVF